MSHDCSNVAILMFTRLRAAAGRTIAGLFLGISATALAACGSSTTTVPTHNLAQTDPQPAGAIEGTLTDRGGCVVIVGESPVLVVWPRNYVRLGSQIMDNGKPVAQVGEQVRLGGGSVSYEQLQRPPASAVIPEACRTGSYWLATGVIPADPDAS